MTGPCIDCGQPVTREPATGYGAHILNGLPLHCDVCLAAQDAIHEAERANRERGDAERTYRRRIEASGLPANHREQNLDDLIQPAPLIDAARNWALTGGGLLLSGEVGRGKTMLAGAAALERQRTHSLIWTSAPLLFARLGSGWDTDSRALALDTLTSNVGLVLDDIDKARPTEYAAEQVFVAIDQRVEHHVPLLVTSNLSPGALAERWPEPFGEAIASRLVGYCRVVRVIGVDRRVTTEREWDMTAASQPEPTEIGALL